MTTFLIIGLAGLVLLAVSLLLGDLFGGAFDALAGDVFSSAVVGGFVAALGFGGALAEAAGASLLLSMSIGVVAGVGFGWFAAWLTRLVRDGGSDATPQAQDALGRDARVLTDIPAGGFGVVRVVLGGHTVRYNARADEPIAAGSDVSVTGVLSPTAVTVAPLWSDLDLPSTQDLDLPPELDPPPPKV